MEDKEKKGEIIWERFKGKRFERMKRCTLYGEGWRTGMKKTWVRYVVAEEASSCGVVGKVVAKATINKIDSISVPVCGRSYMLS